MASPLTLRLDKQTRSKVERIAKRKRVTTSQAVREAITSWIAREEEEVYPYELIKDLIGTVHGGDPHRSKNGGRRVAQMLSERYERQQQAFKKQRQTK